MRARARFVGLLMVIVLLVAVATAGPVTYIVTMDDQGNSYYLESTGEGTLGPQTVIGQAQALTSYGYGIGIGNFTDDLYYDFAVGTGSDPYGQPKEIVLLKRTNGDEDFQKSTIAKWLSGTFPGDLAVANFNGKAYEVPDDFAMVRVGSPDLGMYMKNEEVTFDNLEFEGVIPVTSVGADAADVDHDGNADFVVAQKEGELPYSIAIFLGNGDGSFQSPPHIITSNVPYAGITAADFDGDYKVDLIATIAFNSYGANGFDIYKGHGDGTFDPYVRFGGGWLSYDSPIDNFDLENDGDQDIIASNLVFNNMEQGTSVIVGLNYGAGNFDFDTPQVIPGTTGSYRITLAAPPVFPNEAPYADFSVTPALPDDNNRIAAGTPMTFSGADSEDPEGMPMEFSWKFADDDTLVLTQDASHQFITPGVWDVTLTVTDNYGETATKTVTIDVNHPPVANDDWYDTVYKTPLTISATLGFLANDTDADDDPFTAVWVDGPASGSLTLNADGSFTYDPNDDFTGPEDSFTYKVKDDLNDSNVATVTLNFNEPQKWKVDIVPGTINLKSRGVFIAFITLPQTYNANAVQKETVVCEGAPAIRLIRHAKFPQVFGAIFRTADLNKDLKVRHKVEFTVTGKVESDGQFLDFSGSDTVRVSNSKTKIKDETERFEKQGDKKLFDDYFKGHKAHNDNNDKNDDNDDI